LRGHTHLLKNIHRRKPVHSHSLQNQVSAPLAESERREYEDEINRLKYDKSLLLSDLQKQNQQQCVVNWRMQSLEDRLVQMQQRQKSIVASLCDILQRNGVPLLETGRFSKKRRVPKVSFFADDAAQVPFLQTTGAGAETPSMSPAHPVNGELFDRMEMSLVSLEKFIQRAASDASPEDLLASSAAPSPVVLVPLGGAGVQPAPIMDTNINININWQSSAGGHGHSSAGFAECSCYAQSPVLALPDLQEDAPRTAEADVNSDTTTTDTSQDEATGSHEPAIVNDLFWERFLTETPKFCQTGEDGDCKREPIETNEGAKGQSRSYHRTDGASCFS
jgi:heat shock transcription factor, other eukaryote